MDREARRRARKIATGAAVAVFCCSVCCCAFVRMPGESHAGPLPPFTAAELRVAEALRADITVLAQDIGERNRRARANLDEASAWLKERLAQLGPVETQVFSVDGEPFENHALEIRGISRADEIVIVGAHYDTADGTPGANDNGSGVAVLLHLARALHDHPQPRTVRFVAFVNEEPPFFDSDDMGSRRYANALKARRERVIAMLSLETMGCYFDANGTQKYPPVVDLLYPSTGDFIAFVGDTGSLSLAHEAVESFRSHAAFPSEGAVLPGIIPGVSWSDHASFWRIGVPALMVTDTAPFRYPQYHEIGDTADKVDVVRLARVARGLEGVVIDLATVR